MTPAAEPAAILDQKLSGGVGVMTDDAIAGLMAGVLVVAARFFFHI
jgi:phosphatidylglycerophosphatase A